jgi:hypothetical protein
VLQLSGQGTHTPFNNSNPLEQLEQVITELLRHSEHSIEQLLHFFSAVRMNPFRQVTHVVASVHSLQYLGQALHVKSVSTNIYATHESQFLLVVEHAAQFESQAMQEVEDK